MHNLEGFCKEEPFMEGVRGKAVHFQPQESLQDRGFCALCFLHNMTNYVFVLFIKFFFFF